MSARLTRLLLQDITPGFLFLPIFGSRTESQIDSVAMVFFQNPWGFFLKIFKVFSNFKYFPPNMLFFSQIYQKNLKTSFVNKKSEQERKNVQRKNCFFQ